MSLKFQPGQLVAHEDGGPVSRIIRAEDATTANHAHAFLWSLEGADELAELLHDYVVVGEDAGQDLEGVRHPGGLLIESKILTEGEQYLLRRYRLRRASWLRLNPERST